MRRYHRVAGVMADGLRKGDGKDQRDGCCENENRQIADDHSARDGLLADPDGCQCDHGIGKQSADGGDKDQVVEMIDGRFQQMRAAMAGQIIGQPRAGNVAQGVGEGRKEERAGTGENHCQYRKLQGHHRSFELRDRLGELPEKTGPMPNWERIRSSVRCMCR